jgi:hypothetical protein
MANGPYAIADDNAHDCVKDILPAPLTALSAGLPALILNTLRYRCGNASSTLLSDHTVHDRFSF